MFFLARPACCWTNCGSICRRQPPFWRPCRASARASSRPGWRGHFLVRPNISIDYAVMEKAGKRARHAAADFAGTMWEAGTPSMSCCPRWRRQRGGRRSRLPGRATQLRRRPPQNGGAGRGGRLDRDRYPRRSACGAAATWRSNVGDVSRLSSAGSAKICCRVCRCPTCGKWKLVAPVSLCPSPELRPALTRTTGAFSSYRLSEFAIRGGRPTTRGKAAPYDSALLLARCRPVTWKFTVPDPGPE